MDVEIRAATEAELNGSGDDDENEGGKLGVREDILNAH